MRPLKKWAYGERGRVTRLAHALGLTQPAVSKMMNSCVDIPVKYALKIMEETGLSAKDLYPKHHKIFNDQFKMKEDATIKVIEKKKKELLDTIEAIKKEIESM